ncbi:LapA family protein [candidate division KSB1 bacterium]|nr:LapA family protein [candidate division KSB1 bacterium]
MWIIKWILLVAVILLVIFFAGENTEQEVVVKFWGWQSPPLLLWQVMFISFACGMIVSLGLSIVKIFQLKNEIRKSRKSKEKLAGELDHLRSVSIQDDVDIDLSSSAGAKEDPLIT